MGGFFLHCQATTIIHRLHPVIWESPKDNGSKRVGGQNLSKYGSRGLIYEATGGDITKVEGIEQISIYEFFNYLAFQRQINDRS